MEPESKAPHVLIFPLPAQGHVNSMLNLAQLLSLAGLNITFLNTDDNHNRLVLHTNILHRFACFPGFQFKTIPDGLPVDHPRAGDHFMELFESLKLVTKPIFREMLCSGQLNSATGQSVTCIIADGILSFPIDVGNEIGIPVIHFRTISACSFWVYFCIQEMIEAGELPIRGNEDMDCLIRSVPGMETFFRIRDLPSFCRVSNLADPNLQYVSNMTRQSPRAHALILNTFEDLEGPALSHIRTKCPKTYTIGPLHEILKSKLESKTTLLQSRSPNSLFEVDKSCMVWLNAQPLKSVIYVSFGSITVMTKEELMEFWYGLVNSKKRFLWAIRPDLVTQKDVEGQIPLELVEGTKDRGYMVGWVPQEEVLAHEAVGGFLTHSGWNSTLESIVAGVPMICWPYFADQQTNSRFVSEVWKLGMDMKDVCDRIMIEKMVNHLMEETRETFMKSVTEKARLAKQSVSEDGSSYHNLDHLIKDIRLMSMTTTK
ncbi:7-deoxyloganetic acid glucosyltransferase-like [Castanea sativa]|uniref:7-deoxyloganetic acid glucosyltransferase-like n=1 Tax=Castanea sativa TaxID=21020 RepID=UPI003F64DD5C